jgi:hypothetical protein
MREVALRRDRCALAAVLRTVPTVDASASFGCVLALLGCEEALLEDDAPLVKQRRLIDDHRRAGSVRKGYQKDSMPDPSASPKALSGGASNPAPSVAPMYGLSRVLLALLASEALALTTSGICQTLVTPDALDDLTGVDRILAALWIASALGTGGAMLLALPLWVWWHYRAGTNLVALGREDLQHTPMGHAGWWFVPFANWLMRIARRWSCTKPPTQRLQMTHGSSFRLHRCSLFGGDAGFSATA